MAVRPVVGVWRAGGVFWLLRRFGAGVGVASRQLKVLGGVSLGTRERVVVVQAGGKQLVLGVSPGRVETLCVLEGEDRMQAEPQQASGGPGNGEGEFARHLSGWLSRKQVQP
ncbi:flagellar biosynthetic protein FliO [Methylogaea oryzae]|uniref:flagellar biosynthetic protein FliO n=1 Tax=Methylogaea oryzae TaxID=1295382 RepID=UPI0009E8F9EE